ncbi:NAD(P)-dependent oxidoreductase, partial [Staphylococcus epidermidis]|uniref:NAD(P)-dependent oxidoreductase n=1 Tax=Staphylococcus epidermidis TaxID=1282 RepID=UPI0037D9C890
LDLYRPTLGIFAMRHIAKPFPPPLQPFHPPIIYHNPKPDLNPQTDLNPTYLTFKSLLQQTHFIISTPPLTNQTHNQFHPPPF